VDAPEDQITQPKKRSKDIWDILQTLGPLLITVTIAVVGWRYSDEMSNAQIANSRQMQERDIAVARTEARVKQASLVASFLEALTGTNEPRKKLAIRAVLIALPEDGPNLVRDLSSVDSTVETFAVNALEARRDDLINRLFGSQSQDRIRASEDLVRGWGARSAMIPALLGKGRQHLNEGNGVFNTVGVLSQMDPGALRERRSDVEAFLKEAERAPATGSQIRRLIEQVRGRMNSPG
jgi:hypothetical protein